MLRNLVKYEFHATGRVFAPFLAALIAMSAISRVIGEVARPIREVSENEYAVAAFAGAGHTAYLLGIVISCLLIAAAFVVAYMLTIQRFNKNLLGDEGYLMFTLPTSVDKLVLSKLIVSAAWYLLCAVFSFIAIMLIARISVKSALSAVGDFFSVANGAADAVLLGAQILIAVLLALLGSVLTIYASISIGMLAGKRRGLTAFAVWIGFMTAADIIGTIAASVMFATGFGQWFIALTLRGKIHTIFAIGALVAVVECLIMYFITTRILKHRLNLE